MDVGTLIVSIATTLVVGVSGVLVARYQAKRATKEELAAIVAEVIKPHADRAAQLDARVGALERSEPENVQAVREAVELLVKDLGAVRERLQEHLAEENIRRGKAREMAQAREVETTKQLGELTGHVRRLQERLADLLDAAGGFRGIARSSHAER